MLLTREKKEQLVKDMSGNLKDSKIALLVSFKGLKVNEIRDLKKSLLESGIGLQVVKNTLLKIAVKSAGLEIDESILDQPVAVIWGKDDEVLAAKITREFSKKTENLQILGGFVNQEYANSEIIEKIATLPSREELYAKLVGSLNAPMSRLVNALQGNLRSLVYILKQYQEQKL